MKKNKLVSVIIVNWNGLAYLTVCLTALYKQSYKNIEVILIDNASRDGSVAHVQKHFPRVKTVVNDDNLGFAEGNNIGYRQAKGEYLLFINNDTRIKENAIAKLVTVLDSKPDIGGAQGKILLMDEPNMLDSVGAFLTHTGILYHYGANKKDSSKYNKEIYLYSAKGAFMIFKRNVLEKIQMNNEILDSSYFCYFEETDMCHRVWLTGSKIIYIPSAVIYHKLGGTSSKLNNAFVQYHSFKNRISSYIKNLNFISLITILPLHLLITEGFSLLALAQRNLQLFLAIQKAFYWNLIHIKDTLAKRSFIQNNIRKISDKDIFPYILHDVGLNYYLDMPKALVNYTDITMPKL